MHHAAGRWADRTSRSAFPEQHLDSKRHAHLDTASCPCPKILTGKCAEHFTFFQGLDIPAPHSRSETVLPSRLVVMAAPC